MIYMQISTAHRGMQVSQLLKIYNEHLGTKRNESDVFTNNITV